MKKSFSLIELLIVILISGILYSSVVSSLSDSSLNQVADKLITHINYTRHLAIKNNKMQYYPIDYSIVEGNRSKYWFKQWWQLRIGKNNDGDYFYEIFSDSPYSKSNIFNKVGGPVSEFAIDPYNHLYMAGNYASNPNKELNLSYYHIKVLKYNDEVLNSGSIRIIFDNDGNFYTSEGDKGDNGDINPYDKDKRMMSLKRAKITLCQDENCKKNINICLTPKIGKIYLCE